MQRNIGKIHNEFVNGGLLWEVRMVARVVVGDFILFIFLPLFTVKFLNKMINTH